LFEDKGTAKGVIIAEKEVGQNVHPARGLFAAIDGEIDASVAAMSTGHYSSPLQLINEVCSFWLSVLQHPPNKTQLVLGKRTVF
jgi:hypothetical protein